MALSHADSITPAVRVRRARRRDAEAIAALAMVLGRHILAKDSRTTTDDILTYAFGRQRLCDILVAQDGGRVIGYALYRVFFEGFSGYRRMFLSDLAISAGARRSGVGRALMVALSREALRLGCDVMTWECSDHDPVALGFYGGLNARPIEAMVSLRLDRKAMTEIAESQD